MYLILCYIQKGVCTREESVPTRYAPVALGDGFLHDKGTACAMESQADTNTQSSHPKVDGVAEAEGGDGHPRAVECPVFKSVVYRAEEEWHIELYSGPIVGQQADHSECRNRTDH